MLPNLAGFPALFGMNDILDACYTNLNKSVQLVQSWLIWSGVKFYTISKLGNSGHTQATDNSIFINT